ncbi:hypothetical protein [Atlantibacter hermannii]|nr:hypothetical protein [Atlantibacter hermannii]
MAEKFDFDTVFKLLDQMEACLDKVRELNKAIDQSVESIPKAA